MFQDFKGKTAVITGAGSGFGLESVRLAAARGMNLVLVDVQQDALDRVKAECESLHVQVFAQRVDVANPQQMEALAVAVKQRFGVPHFVFNNAGVGAYGLVWENSVADWEWLIGVNLFGVIHGIRVFLPMMLEAAAKDPNWRGHITNTASMAGLLATPNMGAYSATKAAVVSLSETLFHDVGLVTDQIGVSVLCPYFVRTNFMSSERNRPDDTSEHVSSKAQQIVQTMLEQVIMGSKVTASEVAQKVFRAIETGQFYVFSHESPKALRNVTQRMEHIVQMKNPPDPFPAAPEVSAWLKKELRST